MFIKKITEDNNTFNNAYTRGFYIRPNIVLLDEHATREEAIHLGLHGVGVIGILAEAKINGKIVSIKDELDNLRPEAGYQSGQSLNSQYSGDREECSSPVPLHVSGDRTPDTSLCH